MLGGQRERKRTTDREKGEADRQVLEEMGARQTIDRLICWEDNERERERQTGRRERQTDRC